MSKVICDVCGTSYPETAAQCPICGCARTDMTGVIMAEEASGGYTYVKGGRFSKANVKKRNQALQSGGDGDLPRQGEKKSSSNKWLIVFAALLIAAIIAVTLFIILHFAGIGGTKPTEPVVTEPSVSVQTEPTTEPTDVVTEPSLVEIPCTNIELVKAEIALGALGEAYQLEVSVLPADTTDEIIFTSLDTSIATVDESGKVTAVASGETVITVTCGQIFKECSVVCSLEPDIPVPPSFLLELNRTDFTMSYKGESWDLYDDDDLLDSSYITWTSENPAIASVENGVVTATGSGTTKIHAKLEDQEVTCIVRCEFPSHTGSGGVTEEGSDVYTISHTDVTLRLSNDKSFRLVLKDSAGNTVNVTWSVTDASVCSVSGNTVTALKTGTTTVKVTYAGETYKCIVRVYE